MKKCLFIDRDGTILAEPEDEQVDSFEKMRFLPGAIGALASLAKTDYEPVLVSNQDGLGTPSFPEADFWPVHNLMLRTLAGEGFVFADQLIDRHFPQDNAPTRKPGTGMFGKYLNGDYDLPGSYVLGDRATDVELAYNLGCKAVLLRSPQEGQPMLEGQPYAGSCALMTTDWAEIAEFLRRTERRAVVARKTAETDIRIELDLDGAGESRVDTGLKFFDHMLNQIVHHSGMSLSVVCKGDLEVDEHHSLEDVAIALGEAIHTALGSKRGIDRYGFVLPMDECKALVLLDFGGRADFVWNVPFTREYVGDTPTEMYRHFFKSLCVAMKCNLRIEAEGENNHHLIEGVFKAFARALRMAVRRNVFSYELPSSKGML